MNVRDTHTHTLIFFGDKRIRNADLCEKIVLASKYMADSKVARSVREGGKKSKTDKKWSEQEEFIQFIILCKYSRIFLVGICGVSECVRIYCWCGMCVTFGTLDNFFSSQLNVELMAGILIFHPIWWILKLNTAYCAQCVSQLREKLNNGNSEININFGTFCVRHFCGAAILAVLEIYRARVESPGWPWNADVCIGHSGLLKSVSISILKWRSTCSDIQPAPTFIYGFRFRKTNMIESAEEMMTWHLRAVEFNQSKLREQRKRETKGRERERERAFSVYYSFWSVAFSVHFICFCLIRHLPIRSVRLNRLVSFSLLTVCHHQRTHLNFMQEEKSSGLSI